MNQSPAAEASAPQERAAPAGVLTPTLAYVISGALLALVAFQAWRSAYGLNSQDWVYFKMGGHALFHPHDRISSLGISTFVKEHIGRANTLSTPGGLHLYRNLPFLQIGPLALLLSGGALELTGDWYLTSVVLGLAFSVVCVVALAQLIALRPPVRRSHPATVVLASMACVFPWIAMSLVYTHLDDVMALTFIAVAIRMAREDRAVGLGVWLGLAITAKPIALLAVPLVLVLPSLHDRVRALIPFLLITLAAWLPFVIADPGTVSALGSFTPPTITDSTLRLFGVREGLRPGATLLRDGQFALAGVFALLILRFHARWWPRSAGSRAVKVWASAFDRSKESAADRLDRLGTMASVGARMVAMAFVVRLLTDPGAYSYYRIEELLFVVGIDAMRVTPRRLGGKVGKALRWLEQYGASAVLAVLLLILAHLARYFTSVPGHPELKDVHYGSHPLLRAVFITVGIVLALRPEFRGRRGSRDEALELQSSLHPDPVPARELPGGPVGIEPREVTAGEPGRGLRGTGREDRER